MLTYFSKILWDADEFSALLKRLVVPMRALLGAFGLAVVGGQINLGAFGWWAGPIGLAAAFLVRAGDKNIPVAEQIAAMSDTEKQQLVATLTAKAP